MKCASFYLSRRPKLYGQVQTILLSEQVDDDERIRVSFALVSIKVVHVLYALHEDSLTTPQNLTRHTAVHDVVDHCLRVSEHVSSCVVICCKRSAAHLVKLVHEELGDGSHDVQSFEIMGLMCCYFKCDTDATKMQALRTNATEYPSQKVLAVARRTPEVHVDTAS
jgi:hypothetical protein